LINKQLIFGKNPILEALKSDVKLDRIITTKESKDDTIALIKQLAQAQKVYVQVIHEKQFDNVLFKYKIAKNANHQHIVAFQSLIEYDNLEDKIPHLYEQGITPLVLILDGITDVGNFGAIARSAYCLGVDTLVISHANSAQINEVAMKASAGALNKISVCREFSLRRSVEFLKYNGFKIYATHVENGITLSSVDFREPCAIIMGSEENGVSAELLDKCNLNIHIPMATDFDSLNVSVSTGIVLYEALNQRKK
jgi:23S rRNA (guanosine2251-2'-O)-methyltransferase